jgi:hypothetical protein
MSGMKEQQLEHAKPTWMDETINGVTLIGFVNLYTPEEAAAEGNKLLTMVCEPIYFSPVDEEHEEWQVGLVR